MSTHCKAGILKLSISDHCAIFCISKDSLIGTKNSAITKRSFCDKNVHNFHCNLKQESWNYVYSASGTQPAFTRFQAVIDHHLNNNFKMQTIAMNYKNRHPWMTEELRTQIKHKNALYAETLKKRDKDIQEKYKKLKNELTSSLKNKEILYYSNQLEIHKNDISKSWKIIKQIIGKDSCKSSTNQEFCIGNTSITDSTAIANGFNNFVCINRPKAGQRHNK